jgi:hypothetical protein
MDDFFTDEFLSSLPDDSLSSLQHICLEYFKMRDKIGQGEKKLIFI